MQIGCLALVTSEQCGQQITSSFHRDMNHPLFYIGGSAYFLFLFHLCQQVVSKLVLRIISVYHGIYLASLLYVMDSIGILTTVYCLGLSISQVGLARVVTSDHCLSRIPQVCVMKLSPLTFLQQICLIKNIETTQSIYTSATRDKVICFNPPLSRILVTSNLTNMNIYFFPTQNQRTIKILTYRISFKNTNKQSLLIYTSKDKMVNLKLALVMSCLIKYN